MVYSSLLTRCANHTSFPNQSQLAAAYLRAAGVPVAGDVLGGYEKWREDVDPSFPKLV